MHNHVANMFACMYSGGQIITDLSTTLTSKNYAKSLLKVREHSRVQFFLEFYFNTGNLYYLIWDTVKHSIDTQLRV